MLLLQFTTLCEVHPIKNRVQIHISNCVDSLADSKKWAGKQWAVVKEDEHRLIKRVNAHFSIYKQEHVPDMWCLDASLAKNLVFLFSGISVNSMSTTIDFTDEVSFDEFKTKDGILKKRVAAHCINGIWKSKPFKVKWKECSNSEEKSEVIFESGNRVQTMGTVSPWSAFRIVWIGDINGDGKMDILTQSEDDKGFGNTALFLGVNHPTLAFELGFYEDTEGYD